LAIAVTTLESDVSAIAGRGPALDLETADQFRDQ